MFKARGNRLKFCAQKEYDILMLDSITVILNYKRKKNFNVGNVYKKENDALTLTNTNIIKVEFFKASCIIFLKIKKQKDSVFFQININ